MVMIMGMINVPPVPTCITTRCKKYANFLPIWDF